MSKEENRNWHKETFEASAASSSAPGPAWALDPSWRTVLKTTTNNLRLKLERRKESFRAEENQRQSGKMSLLIFSGLTPVFAVRFAHSMPAKLAARKRWTATLFLVAFVAFTATNAGFLLLF